MKGFSLPDRKGDDLLAGDLFEIRIDLHFRNRREISRPLVERFSTEVRMDGKGCLSSVSNDPDHIPRACHKVAAGKEAPDIGLKGLRINLETGPL